MSQEETDYAWLDSPLIEFGHDIYLVTNRDTYDKAVVKFKAKVQSHFTAQAKQHQADLLRARINELELSVGYTTTGNKATRQYVHKRLVTLQDELTKLEGEE